MLATLAIERISPSLGRVPSSIALGVMVAVAATLFVRYSRHFSPIRAHPRWLAALRGAMTEYARTAFEDAYARWRDDHPAGVLPMSKALDFVITAVRVIPPGPVHSETLRLARAQDRGMRWRER